MLLLALGVGEPASSGASSAFHWGAEAALREALATRDFWLLSLGFFACGFRVVSIAVHLTAFPLDEGVDVRVATTVLALIGLVNRPVFSGGFGF